MNTPTYPDEPTTLLELSLSVLKHIIFALVAINNSDYDQATLDRNGYILPLLVEHEHHLVQQLNQDLAEEDWVRENGEL